MVDLSSIRMDQDIRSPGWGKGAGKRVRFQPRFISRLCILTVHKGTYDYRALPLPGASVFRDHSRVSSWGYDPQKKEMISFDDEATALAKATWILDLGLGGAMYWELSGTFLLRLELKISLWTNKHAV